MAVPLQSDVPTFLAPAHGRLEYVPGSIVVRVHEDVREPFDYLEREAGAHAVETVDGDLTIVWLDDREVSPQLLRTVESSPAVALPSASRRAGFRPSRRPTRATTGSGASAHFAGSTPTCPMPAR